MFRVKGFNSHFFLFSSKLNGLESMRPIVARLRNSNSCVSSRAIDIISNLPEIGCLELIKSLFFMVGGFPYTDESGVIKVGYFSDLQNNLKIGNVLDWSNRIYGKKQDYSESIKYSSSKFAQNNYYKMKSDENDGDREVYANGTGVLRIEDVTLKNEQTIIQLPFYPPYIKDKKIHIWRPEEL